MTKLAAALRRLGLSEPATRVYAALLDGAPITATDLSVAMGRHEADVLAAYAELVARGLADHRTADDDLLTPVPPAAAVEVLAQRRQADLDEARMTISSSYEMFRRSRLAGAGDVMEVVTGDDVAVRLRAGWMAARKEIRQLESPPYAVVPSCLADALTTLERGIRQRVVYSRASLMTPGRLEEAILPCIERGELVRVVASVPVKLIVVDDDLAMLSPSIRESDVHHTMFVVHPSGLLTAVIDLFEQTWEHALPFAGTEPGTSRLSKTDRDLLILLASGMRDDEVAHGLEISRRTLSRRLEMLMVRTGAASRFQLALHARQRGWL